MLGWKARTELYFGFCSCFRVRFSFGKIGMKFSAQRKLWAIRSASEGVVQDFSTLDSIVHLGRLLYLTKTTPAWRRGRTVGRMPC